MNEDLSRLTRNLQDAVVRQSRDALEDLVALDFRLITSRQGNPVTRDEWIAAAVGPFRLTSYELSDFHAIMAGDVGVASYRMTQDAHMGGRAAPREWLSTDVWTRSTDRWQIIARHAEALSE